MRNALRWLIPRVYLSREHCHLFLFGLVLNYWHHTDPARHQATWLNARKRRLGALPFGFWCAGRRPHWQPWRYVFYAGPFEVYCRCPR